MTDFIELHNSNGDRLLINVAAIAAVIPIDDEARIEMIANTNSTSACYHVKESYDEIKRKIAAL